MWYITPSCEAFSGLPQYFFHLVFSLSPSPLHFICCRFKDIDSYHAGMQDDSLGDKSLLAVSIVLITISSLFVGARLWARFVVLRKAGWDDYTIIPAYVS